MILELNLELRILKKGLVATDVKLEKIVEESQPLTDNDIKAMFGVLLVFQLVTAYFVFFA